MKGDALAYATELRDARGDIDLCVGRFHADSAKGVPCDACLQRDGFRHSDDLAAWVQDAFDLGAIVHDGDEGADAM